MQLGSRRSSLRHRRRWSSGFLPGDLYVAIQHTGDKLDH